MKHPYQLIEAPSILGHLPSGVELLPYALQRYGFLKGTPPPLAVPSDIIEFSPHRASRHEVLNAGALAAYTGRLADAVQQVRASGRFPVVLGGDCSILLGCVLALKETGTYGLAHVDAHADFYGPEDDEAEGQAAAMDLALSVGRGPAQLTNLRQQRPYVQERHAVQIGQRDADSTQLKSSSRVRESAVHSLDLAALRHDGVATILAQALETLNAPELAGYWIHFDVDVLADDIMPAVDYRLPGGLSFAEASALLRGLLAMSTAAGLSITIFNPKLDPEGQLTRQLVDCLHQALR